MNSVDFGGKKIYIKMNTWALEKLEEIYGDSTTIFKKMEEGKIRDTVTMLEVLATAAAVEREETPTTREWISLHLPPKMIPEVAEKLAETINKGLTCETMEEEEETDVVLAEIEKKTASR